jgi:hypothetical protein
MKTYVSGLNDAKFQFKTPSIDAMHIYLRLNGMYCRLWRPPLQTWIQALVDISNNNI